MTRHGWQAGRALRAAREGPVRVLHLIKQLERGGAEVLLAEGARYFDKNRFELGYGYFVRGTDDLANALQEEGFSVRCYGADESSLRLPLRLPSVIRHIREWRPALLHCHLPLVGSLGRLASRLTRVPVVYTEHCLLERYHPLTRQANILTWGHQEHVIAVSGEVAASIERHALACVPVAIVPNGVCTQRFAPSAELRNRGLDRIDVRPGTPIVGTVAVFRKQKRLDVWVRAAEAIREQCPGTHFVLVGDGPDHPSVVAAIKSSNLAVCTHLIGLQADVRPYLAAMDVYLMSSDFEGLPVAMLEARAMGLPVVATAVGGIPEALTPEEQAYLSPAGEPARLAEAVVMLLSAPDLRRSIGRAARADTIARFGMRRMVDDLQAVYEAVLANPERKAARA